MTPREFFDAVSDIMGKTESDDDDGVGFFIGDIERLIDEWEERE